MHISCALITHGKPTLDQIDELLENYYAEHDDMFFETHDTFPLWDWYVVGGRMSGHVVTPLDTPADTLTYGDTPFTSGAYDDNVWGHNSDGAYIKDILRQHPLTNTPFVEEIYCILTPDNFYESPGDNNELFDKIIFEIFAQDSNSYLTVLDLHI